MINSAELPITDEARMCPGWCWCSYYKQRCAVVLTHTQGRHIKKGNGKLVMLEKVG